jgi:hypothetical protein
LQVAPISRFGNDIRFGGTHRSAVPGEING